MTPAEAIEAAELAGAQSRYHHRVAREMYARGPEPGLIEGCVLALSDLKAVQHGIVRDAEPEALRYRPGGRAHFADPRPGGFPGRGTQREAELELEAG